MREYGFREALEMTDATTSQLVHWNRTGVIIASVKGATGKGSRAVYNLDDLVALMVATRLANRFAMPVQVVRQAARLVRHAISDSPRAELLVLAPATTLPAMFSGDYPGLPRVGRSLAQLTQVMTTRFPPDAARAPFGDAWWGTAKQYAAAVGGRQVGGEDFTSVVIDLAAIDHELTLRGATA